MSGNMTVITCINNMSSMKSDSGRKIAHSNIWDFCITGKLWISAAHIPRVYNEEADMQSRIPYDTTE